MTCAAAYIGLGSNLGDRMDYIDKAIRLLAEADGVKIVCVSDIIETAAIGNIEQNDYLNAVVQVQSVLDAHSLLGLLREIENKLDRQRSGKWSARTIDLDLLLFDDEVINSDTLTVPHPQMHLRSFVLKGLCQLNPDLQHPVMKVSAGQLSSRLNGCDFVVTSDKPLLISIAGNIGAGKTTLAVNLSDHFAGEVINEPYDKNPFLPAVYAGKTELALDSQLFFLTGRAEQLDKKTLQTGRIYISDYIFEKEKIYAEATLGPEQLSLYQQIYKPFAEIVCSPVLVIYLEDSEENCLERIHLRNRPYEQKIELEFLRKLDYGYRTLFAEWKKSPLIRISSSIIDYTERANIDYLVNQVKCYIA